MLIKRNKMLKTFLGSFILWIIFIVLIFSINQVLVISTKNQILESIHATTNEISNLMNKEVETKLKNLKLIAHYLTDEDLAHPEVTVKMFAEMVEKNNFKKMAITLPDGTAYLHSGEIINVSDREYFQESMKGNTYISSLVESKVDSKGANVYSVPIIKNDKVVGILWASLLTEVFYDTLNLNNLDRFGDVMLIDEEGTLITQKDMSQIDTNFFDLIEEYYGEAESNQLNSEEMKDDFENFKDNYKYFSYRGGGVYIYYSKLDHGNWWILTEVSDEKINEMNREISTIVFGVSIVLFLLASGSTLLFYFSIRKSHDELKKVAYHDYITDGNNDIFLKNNIKKIINKKEKFAFISLEIVNIKSLISIMGFTNSQYLLKDMYDFISEKLNKGEFVVHSYLGEYKLILKYEDIADLITRLEELIRYKERSNIDIKVGIFLINSLDIDFEEMCAYANMAKESLTHNNTYAFYTNEIHKKEMNNVRLEADIKNGILHKEFKAWFQPKCGNDGKTLVGAEALVRWYKYDSIISPYIFIPVCEANGLIKKIDELLLEDVCRNLRIWINNKKKVVPISVNLSRSYLDNLDCVDKLERIINRYDIPKYLIEFEITESSMSESETELKQIIDKFHDKGFKVLLDDFGMGYSSISTVDQMNFDVMKIDKSFIDRIGTKEGEDILKYTIQLARSLEMEIVAEGVETIEQSEFLYQHECDQIQGYYYSKPLSSSDFSRFMEEHLDF